MGRNRLYKNNDERIGAVKGYLHAHPGTNLTEAGKALRVGYQFVQAAVREMGRKRKEPVASKPVALLGLEEPEAVTQTASKDEVMARAIATAVLEAIRGTR